MKLIPTGNLVLVKPILPQARTSPIVRADAFEQERVQAVVYEAGPGRMTRKGIRIAPEVSKGQIIHIGPNPLHAQEVVLGSETFLLVPETSILAVVRCHDDKKSVPNPDWVNA